MPEPTSTTPPIPTVEEQEAASKAVRDVGIELIAIKNAMKKISSTMDFSTNGQGSSNNNTLKVTAMKITGLPDSAEPKITLQLSSPIESKTITKIFDPLDDDNNVKVESSTDLEEAKDDKKEEEEKVEEPSNEEDDKSPAKEDGDEEKNETNNEETDDTKEEGEEVELKEEKEETTNNDDENSNSDAAQDQPTESTTKPTSNVTFEGVDTSVATLTFELFDADIPLGTSATMYDVSPLCEVDVLKGITKKVTDLEVAIVPTEDDDNNGVDNVVEEEQEKHDGIVKSDSELFQDAVEEENEVDGDVDGDGEAQEEKEEVKEEEKVVAKEDDKIAEENKEGDETPMTKDDEEEAKTENEVVETTDESTTETKEETKDDDDKEAPKKVIVPICTVSLKIEYNASMKDQTLLLNEKYNAAVARQTVAVEKLRKIATSVRRAQLAAASGGNDKALTTMSANKKPAVKPGFLKKTAVKKEPMFLVRWYEKTLGPNSLLRKVYPIAKNYVLFFGGVVLMHYQGHQLALPPPV